MSLPELTSKLGLGSNRSHNWNIMASCATSGEGLAEGFQWLSDAVKKKTQGQLPPKQVPAVKEETTNNKIAVK